MTEESLFALYFNTNFSDQYIIDEIVINFIIMDVNNNGFITLNDLYSLFYIMDGFPMVITHDIIIKQTNSSNITFKDYCNIRIWYLKMILGFELNESNIYIFIYYLYIYINLLNIIFRI